MAYHFKSDDFKVLTICPICGGRDVSKKYSRIAKEKFLEIQSEFDIFVCNRCKNGFLNPQPVIDILPKLYPKEYFNDYKKIKLMSAPLTGSKRYLEIGIGDGSHLQKIIDSGLYTEIWVVDLSTAGFAFGDKELPKKFVLKQESIDTVKLPKGNFDFIYLAHVIEHTTTPVSIIKKLYRSLRVGGQVEIATPNFDCLNNWLLNSKSYYSCPNHLYFFTISGIKKILKMCDICDYKLSTHWGNMLAYTLSKRVDGVIKRKITWMILSPISIVLEMFTGRKDTIEVLINKV